MRRSPLTHVLAVLIALVASVCSLVLFGTGGTGVWQAFVRFDFGGMGLPIALQVGGCLLLLVVILTGIRSSAGLLAVGFFSILGLLLTSIPHLLGILVGDFRLPMQTYEIALSGLLSIGFGILGASGIAAAIARRTRSASQLGARVAVHVATPLLLLGGITAIIWGLNVFTLYFQNSFGGGTPVTAGLAQLVGLLMVAAGTVLAARAPMSLLLPAATIAVVTILLFIPGRMPWFLSRTPASISFLVLAGGATAFVLVCTAVMLAIIRRRALQGPQERSDVGAVPNPYAQHTQFASSSQTPNPHPGTQQGWQSDPSSHHAQPDEHLPPTHHSR